MKNLHQEIIGVKAPTNPHWKIQLGFLGFCSLPVFFVILGVLFNNFDIFKIGASIWAGVIVISLVVMIIWSSLYEENYY